jgi:hypothetical protein
MGNMMMMMILGQVLGGFWVGRSSVVCDTMAAAASVSCYYLRGTRLSDCNLPKAWALCGANARFTKLTQFRCIHRNDCEILL